MQQPLELILTRQWASHLEYAVWVMNDKGTLVFYNEGTEKILGLNYKMGIGILSKDLSSIFKNTDEDGKPIPSQCLPINIALTQRKPAHIKMKLCALDGVWRLIETTAFPLIGQGGRFLGAISIFWEIKES